MPLRPRQDLSKFAIKRGIDLAAFLAWSEDDLLNQHPQGLGRFLALCGAIQGLCELCDLLRVDR
ncbi:MAG: hypothetical protein R2724_34400 [Bryobacterales bacterium]